MWAWEAEATENECGVLLMCLIIKELEHLLKLCQMCLISSGFIGHETHVWWRTAVSLMEEVELFWILLFQQQCISTTILPEYVIFFAH